MTKRVDIDPDSGFCFGVVNAIKHAEEALDNLGSLNCLGDIVHNGKEIDRLTAKGLRTVSTSDFKRIAGKPLLIRAHGEPPVTYENARQHNISVIDATCPIVLKLQQRVQKAWEKMQQCNGQIVIFGKPFHAEVIGLNGYANNEAIIIQKLEDVEHIDVTRPIQLYSQTTMSESDYLAIVKLLKQRCKAVGNTDFDFFNSICGSVSGRSSGLLQFALQYDRIVFVSSRKSSNGNYLYTLCQSKNANTFFVTGPDDIQADWFKGAASIGITGATSTPHWLMEEVKAAILAL